MFADVKPGSYVSQRLILVLQRHIHISFSSFLISLQHASVCNSVIKDFLDHPRKSMFNMEVMTHTRQDIFSYVNGDNSRQLVTPRFFC